MKRRIYLVHLLAIMALLPGCNEKMEDTYKDFAGDGKIRYVAKCSEPSIFPGWERLRVEWKNGTDAMVENIKVSWAVADTERDSLLDKSATSCDIKNLREDGTYRIEIRAVSKDGSVSLVETTSGRPFTEHHEALRSFSRGITKFYRVKDKLVFFMDKWNDNIEEMYLHYTDIQGKEKAYPLTKEVFAKNFIVLPDVNTEKPLSITRSGRMEGCPDLIRFTPYVLGSERALSSGFKNVVQLRYGFTDQTGADKEKLEHFIDTVRVLEFDYDMPTFEDVLYCPKLEKLVLGKNRYLHPSHRVPADTSILYDVQRSFKVLDAAYELLGLRVERYNGHYFKEKRNYIDEMGYLPPPANLTYLTEFMGGIENSIPETDGYDSGLKNLMDNKPETWWEPFRSQDKVRSHELVTTLKSPQFMRGIKIVQPSFDPSMDKNSASFLPGSVQVMVSYDNIIWKNAGFVREVPMGRGIGEVTLIPLVEPGEYKYIKVVVNDRVLVTDYKVKLADIVPYR